MSSASIRIEARASTWSERSERWFAGTISVLVQLLMLMLLLMASKPTIAPPHGASSGSRMKVDFLGESRQPIQPLPTPPSHPQVEPKKAPASKVRVSKRTRQYTPRQEADPDPRQNARQPKPQPKPQPPSPPQESTAQTPPAPPPSSATRHPETWTGRPPGMLDTDTADADSGLAEGDSDSSGSRNDYSSGPPSMEVGGYMVYYDVRSETLLRTWKAQGIKELAIPLPGTEYYMVCQLQVAIDRGSGKCRLLLPSSPQMKTIGEGRAVINMMQVYHQGQPVWTGPGPYR